MFTRFSPSVGCFYPYDISYPVLPDDLIDATEGDYTSAMRRSAGDTLAVVAGAVVVVPAPAPDATEQLKYASDELLVAVQGLLDATARTRGYDGILSAVSYADEPTVAVFQKEAKSLRVWRSKVWEKCYQLFDQVKVGTIPAPSAEQLLAMLPTVEW